MTKADIISKTLREMGAVPLQTETPFGDQPDEPAFIISVLREVLPADTDIRTCGDFRHLDVRCCEICHHSYPHHDMSLVDLADGGKAWVCDTVKCAICPENRRQLRGGRNSLLRDVFGQDVAGNGGR